MNHGTTLAARSFCCSATCWIMAEVLTSELKVRTETAERGTLTAALLILRRYMIIEINLSYWQLQTKQCKIPFCNGNLWGLRNGWLKLQVGHADFPVVAAK
jgi:hypothetical protein